MKLIIDIPTDTYNKLMKYKEFYINTTIFSAITNGTPVSTDGDLISREDLKKSIKSYADDQYAENEYLGEYAIMDIIDNAPCANCQEFDCYGCKVKEADNDK